jgi:hypothetical protein
VLAPIAAVAAVALAGCGGEDEAAPATTVPTITAPATVERTEPQPPLAYLVRDGKVAPVARPRATTPKAALDALLAGPTDVEAGFGLETAVPDATRVLRFSIDEGIARVELSSGFAEEDRLPLAQVVYTLTQFPDVDEVLVVTVTPQGIVESGPAARDAFERQTPAILVESPTPGERVTSPLRLRGTANTFEATFHVRMESEGRILAEDFVTATSGSGTRGTFDKSLPFETAAGPVSLVVFEPSAEDGSELHTVRIPLLVGG